MEGKNIISTRSTIGNTITTTRPPVGWVVEVGEEGVREKVVVDIVKVNTEHLQDFFILFVWVLFSFYLILVVMFLFVIFSIVFRHPCQMSLKCNS